LENGGSDLDEGPARGRGVVINRSSQELRAMYGGKAGNTPGSAANRALREQRARTYQEEFPQMRLPKIGFSERESGDKVVKKLY